MSKYTKGAKMADFTKEDLTNDDVFAAFVNNAESKRMEEKAKKENGGFTPREYEQPQWVGLKDDECRIFRIMGNPPQSMTQKPAGPYDAKEIYFSTILDDKGKRMQLKLPVRSEDPSHEHIMWRIIDAVKEVSWVDKQKVFKNSSYPWFDRVVHGGYDQVKDAFQYKISKGWSGQQIVIMNVIDRGDSWCKDNKHTKLLSKKVNVKENPDGTVTEYPTIGVPSYGFLSELATLCGSNGPWYKYDIALKRTGELQKPYEIYAASVLKKAGLSNYFDKTGTVSNLVSLDEDYTAEEKEYERYDISKLYAPSTYSKILNHLGDTIKAIDASLHRNYFEELQSLVEEEKKVFAEKYPQGETSAPTANVQSGATSINSTPVEPMADPLDPMGQTPAQATPVQSAPVAESAPSRSVVREATATATPVTSGLSADKIALLKGWDKLTEDEKNAIVDVETKPDGTLSNIIYKPEAGAMVTCPENDGGCGFASPLSFLSCPVCGCSFA